MAIYEERVQELAMVYAVLSKLKCIVIGESPAIWLMSVTL
jgi:hypothetical protein